MLEYVVMSPASSRMGDDWKDASIDALPPARLAHGTTFLDLDVSLQEWRPPDLEQVAPALQ